MLAFTSQDYRDNTCTCTYVLKILMGDSLVHSALQCPTRGGVGGGVGEGGGRGREREREKRR